MYEMKKICIIGGDVRMYRLGRQLEESGVNVSFFGFEKIPFARSCASLEDALSGCGCVVLPVPLSRDEQTVFMPLSDTALRLDGRLASLLKGRRIFTSNAAALAKSGDYEPNMIFDYFNREPVKIENAVLTAEGAVCEAIKNSDRALYLSRCLVAGYGRIGKPLCRLLRAFGANVAVSARRDDDLTWIGAEGFLPVHTAKLAQSGRYDFIFNTVPSLIFTKEVLERTAADALVIDLASLPGGVDKDACAALGIKLIHALSLPGRISPDAAAAVIKKSLMSINSENERVDL